MNDTFGFRSQLLTGHSLLHLGIGMAGSERYVLGKAGWLFHRTIDAQLDQARGIDVFTEPELEAWVRTMERRQLWLESRGIGFLVVIAPAKHSIYPEFLPDWANRVGPTRYDQLVERLGRDSSLNFLDLREPLRRAKAEASHPLYFQGDGHWNDLGAYVAYRAIVAHLSERFPEVRPLEMSQLRLEWRQGTTGTIALGLNLHGILEEVTPTLTLEAPSRVTTGGLIGSGPLWGFSQIAAFETNRQDLPSVLFFRDSFSQPIGRLLRESLDMTILAHHRQGGFQPALVDRFEPDVVIYEMIERGLRWPLRPQ